MNAEIMIQASTIVAFVALMLAAAAIGAYWRHINWHHRVSIHATRNSPTPHPKTILFIAFQFFLLAAIAFYLVREIRDERLVNEEFRQEISETKQMKRAYR